VDNPGETILDLGLVEIDQQTERLSCQTQISQELFLVDILNLFYGFEFHNDGILN